MKKLKQKMVIVVTLASIQNWVTAAKIGLNETAGVT